MTFPDATQRPLHDPVIGKVFAADLVFNGGEAEQNNRLDLTASQIIDFPVKFFVGRELEHSGHGADLALHPAAMNYEQGLNEIGGSELVLPDEAAHSRGKPAAAGPMERGKGHKGRLESGKPARNQRSVPMVGPGTCFAFFYPRTLFLRFHVLIEEVLHWERGWPRTRLHSGFRAS